MLKYIKDLQNNVMSHDLSHTFVLESTLKYYSPALVLGRECITVPHFQNLQSHLIAMVSLSLHFMMSLEINAIPELSGHFVCFNSGYSQENKITKNQERKRVYCFVTCYIMRKLKTENYI